MNKIWLKSYPPGVPAEIDPGEFRSLNDIVAQSCREVRGPHGLCADGSRKSAFASSMSRQRHFGAWLQNEQG